MIMKRAIVLIGLLLLIVGLQACTDFGKAKPVELQINQENENE